MQEPIKYSIIYKNAFCYRRFKFYKLSYFRYNYYKRIISNISCKS